MVSTAPIFIMSSERTGSNLLRTLLSNHEGIAAPPAPQLLSGFRGAAELFEPVGEQDRAVTLARAMLAVANHPVSDWGLDIDPLELVRRERPADWLELVDALYRAKRDQAGGRRYVCKENRLFDFMDELLARWPRSAVLYLARDPRDYAASWLKVPLLHNTAHQAARAWSIEQRLCLGVEARHGTRVRRVLYEELIAAPREVMTGVLEHLGEPVDPACFEVQTEKNSAQAWSSFWTNLTRPIQRDNRLKYREAFDRRTLEMIETVCAGEMAALGYAPETRQSWRAGPLFPLRERLRARRTDRKLRSDHAGTVAAILDRQRLLDELLEDRRRAPAHA